MTSKATTVRYQVMFFLFTAAAISYLCRQALGVAESEIRLSLQMTKEQTGYLMSAFFVTYSVMQLPSGIFSERVGTRISLSLYALGWSLACFATGWVSLLPALILAQAIMGIAQAGIFPAACGSINYWMPVSKRSSACGLLAAGMQFGAIASAILTGYLLLHTSWRNVFLLYSIPGIIWAVLFYVRFRDRPTDSPAVNSEELALIRRESQVVKAASDEETENQTIDWKQFLKGSQIWLLCGQQICRSSAYMFFASWFPTYLQETRGISVEKSGYFLALVLGGSLAGCLLGGHLTDSVFKKTGRLRLSRVLMGVTALGTCGLLVLASFFVEHLPSAVTLLTLGSIFAAIAGPATLATTIDIGGPRVPQVYGLVNMAGNIAAASTPTLVGMYIDKTGQWHFVLLSFSLIYLLGAACWLFINPQVKVPLKEIVKA